MATTTNYAWETPDDTDLVKDGAAAIRTLGSSIDTTTKALNPETTLGDISYRSSTANTKTRLGIGTTGQVLTVAGGVPTWATPAGGGGKVLQVVQATYDLSTTIASTTYTDTGLSATITPSSTSSKIYVQVVQMALVARSTTDNGGGGIRLLRGSTSIFEPATGKYEQNFLSIPGSSASSVSLYLSIPVNYLDSPASTSALTYKTQGAIYTTANSGTSTYQIGNSKSTITLWEIGA